MPNHHPSEQIDLLQEELRAGRADTARVMAALDAAMQLIDALLLFLPHGQVLPDNLGSLKYRLDEALANIRRKP